MSRTNIRIRIFCLSLAMVGGSAVWSTADEAAAIAAWNSGNTSWALTLYDRVLAKDPGNREALIRTALIQSWKQKHADALRRYERVLEKDPSDLEALVGKGGALVALGANYEARPLMERLTRELPDRMEPKLGLAWMDLFSSPRDAMPAVRDLEKRFPNEVGVKAISKVSKMVTAPTVSFSQGRSTDSIDNETNASVVEGRFNRGSTQFKFSAGRMIVSAASTSTEADISAGEANLTMNLAGGSQVLLKGGIESQKGSRSTNTYPVYGASLQFGAKSRWSGRVGVDREPVRYSLQLVDSEARVDRVLTSLSFKASRTITFSFDGTGGRISSLQGNANRFNSTLSVQKKIMVLGRLPVDTGYQFGYTDHSRDLNNGVWMPAGQKSHSIFARSFVSLPSGMAYFLALGVGTSDYRTGTAPTERVVKGDINASAILMVTLPIPKSPLSVELLGVRSAGGLEQTTGFTSNTVGARLVWKGGPR